MLLDLRKIGETRADVEARSAKLLDILAADGGFRQWSTPGEEKERDAYEYFVSVIEAELPDYAGRWRAWRERAVYPEAGLQGVEDIKTELKAAGVGGADDPARQEVLRQLLKELRAYSDVDGYFSVLEKVVRIAFVNRSLAIKNNRLDKAIKAVKALREKLEDDKGSKTTVELAAGELVKLMGSAISLSNVGEVAVAGTEKLYRINAVFDQAADWLASRQRGDEGSGADAWERMFVALDQIDESLKTLASGLIKALFALRESILSRWERLETFRDDLFVSLDDKADAQELAARLEVAWTFYSLRVLFGSLFQVRVGGYEDVKPDSFITDLDFFYLEHDPSATAGKEEVRGQLGVVVRGQELCSIYPNSIKRCHSQQPGNLLIYYWFDPAGGKRRAQFFKYRLFARGGGRTIPWDKDLCSWLKILRQDYGVFRDDFLLGTVTDPVSGTRGAPFGANAGQYIEPRDNLEIDDRDRRKNREIEIHEHQYDAGSSKDPDPYHAYQVKPSGVTDMTNYKKHIHHVYNPRWIQGLPRIDTAYATTDGKRRIYFFGGSWYVRYDLDEQGDGTAKFDEKLSGDEVIERSSVRPIGNLARGRGWQGLWADGVDAAARNDRGKVFFFRSSFAVEKKPFAIDDPSSPIDEKESLDVYEYPASRPELRVVQFDLGRDEADGDPRLLADSWPGFPWRHDRIDDALFLEGRVYVFRGDELVSARPPDDLEKSGFTDCRNDPRPVGKHFVVRSDTSWSWKGRPYAAFLHAPEEQDLRVRFVRGTRIVAFGFPRGARRTDDEGLVRLESLGPSYTMSQQTWPGVLRVP